MRPFFETINKTSTNEQVVCYNKLLNNEVVKTLDNVDEFIIAPMYGFKDKFDYRRHASVTGRLNEIKVPCFYLHSWDDIIIGRKSVNDQEFSKVDNLILATTAIGGHCCHF